MTYFLTAIAALVAGLSVGWFGHRRVWTWCDQCTRPVGRLCANCQATTGPQSSR
jgi:hypothetical protein